MTQRTLASALDQIEKLQRYNSELRLRIAELETRQWTVAQDGVYAWARDEVENAIIDDDDGFDYAICKRSKDKTHDTSHGSRVPTPAAQQP